MADDFYPFVDSGDPAPDNRHITGISDGQHTDMANAELGAHADQAKTPQDETAAAAEPSGESTVFATRIAIYDDMLSTPRVIVVQPKDPRSYLEEITNTVYHCMKEQGGSLSLMVIRELVENFIHAHFTEPIVSILDGGNTIRFADQGPGINDKERAFEFGVTSANRSMKRYIRGTGAGLPMVQQYLENAGGAVSIEDNLGAGTVVTVSVDQARVAEIEANSGRGAAVRGTQFTSASLGRGIPQGGYAGAPNPYQEQYPYQPGAFAQVPGQGFAAGAGSMPAQGYPQQAGAWPQQQAPYPQQPAQYQQATPQGAPAQQQTGSFQQAAPYTQAGLYQQTGFPQQYGYPAQPSYGMGWGFSTTPEPGFQQSGQEFSTIQQHMPQAGETQAQQAAADTVQNRGANEPFLTERGLQALDFLVANGQCGPTELTNAFGHSGPTWSRELATLSGYGFATKHGRKYFLTELGAAWIAEHRAQN